MNAKPSLTEFEKRFYSFVYDRDDLGPLQFMNYGFVSQEQSTSVALGVIDPAFRTQVQLYDYVARRTAIENRRVLEVGCGRAGGAAYITATFGPRSYAGMDVARGSLRQGAKNNSSSRLALLAAKAEFLPFAEGTFDVILNVESSHRYKPFERFLEGCKRALVPGGMLVLADFRSLVGVDELRRALFASGLILEDEVNISRNVFDALRQDSVWRMEMITQLAPEEMWPALQEYGGVRGSWIYNSLESGDAKYLCYTLRKP